VGCVCFGPLRDMSVQVVSARVCVCMSVCICAWQVLYENMLTELPFASFFLSKLLSSQKGDVDIHHLASLDPEMYR